MMLDVQVLQVEVILIFQGKHRAVLISYADKDRIESYIQIKNG